MQWLTSAAHRGSRASLLAMCLVALLAVIASAAPLRGGPSAEPTVLRPDRFAPVSVAAADFTAQHGMPFLGLGQQADASLIGTPVDQVPPQQLTYPSVAAAEQELHRKARVPSSLPPGVTGDPEVTLLTASSAGYILDLPKLQRLMATAGLPDVQLPTALHGAKVTADVPAALTLRWGTGHDGLALVQMREPRITVPGQVELPAIRDILLNHPAIVAMNPEIVAELRGIEQWQTTMPVPVPSGAEAQAVRVDGADGLLITGSHGEGSALVWQRNGSVYGLTGPFSAQELLAVADSLR